jgi:folylpolyglutamate synthase/dihydropteroate synthase
MELASPLSSLLTSLRVFEDAAVDIVILEVGLAGLLDANWNQEMR